MCRAAAIIKGNKFKNSSSTIQGNSKQFMDKQFNYTYAHTHTHIHMYIYRADQTKNSSSARV